MALFDDIPVFEDILSGGNWVTGLAIGIGAFAVLPLAAPVLRPLAKTAIKGGILAYRGAAGLVGDLVAEVAAEGGGEIAAEAVEAARKQHERGRQKQRLRQKKPRLGRRRGFSTGDPGLGELIALFASTRRDRKRFLIGSVAVNLVSPCPRRQSEA